MLAGVVALRRFMRGVMAAEQIVPLGSEEYCQNITPVFHPLNLKLATRASPILEGLIYELEFASTVVAGFPTTILLLGIPLAMI